MRNPIQPGSHSSGHWISGFCSLGHGFFGYLLRYIYLRFIVGARFLQGSRKTRTSRRVVVSLTTIPSRLPHIAPTINSLVLQSHVPDRIVLNIPMVSARENRSYDIPASLANHPKVFINRCTDDLGPIMKLLPTLDVEQDSETIIITVDDDIIYARSLVKELLAAHAAHPGCALGLRGVVLNAQGRYDSSEVLFSNRVTAATEVDILSGVSSVLYQRDQFKNDFLQRDSLPAESYFVDDVCISGYLHKSGIARLLVPTAIAHPFTRRLLTKNTNPLWLVNRDGHNDQVMVDYYFGNRHEG